MTKNNMPQKAISVECAELEKHGLFLKVLSSCLFMGINMVAETLVRPGARRLFVVTPEGNRFLLWNGGSREGEPFNAGTIHCPPVTIVTSGGKKITFSETEFTIGPGGDKIGL